MGVFSALGTIAFTFGDTLLPEIQVRSDIHSKLHIMSQGRVFAPDANFISHHVCASAVT